MNTTAHIIRKQNLQLRVSQSGNALALQQRFLRVMDEQVLPRLEQVFDRLAGPDEWIEIDQLEVNIGTLAPDAKEEIWVENILSAYTAALEKQMPGTNTNTPARQQSDLLWYFLQHGVLPWWGAGQNLEELVKKQLPHIAAQLPGKLAAPNTRRRWVRRFGDDLQGYTLDIVLQSNFGSLPLSLATWQRWFPGTPGHVVRNAYWESLWEAALQPGDLLVRWPALLLKHGLSFLPDGLESAWRLWEAAFRFNDFARWPAAFQSAWLQAAATAVRETFYTLPTTQKRQISRKMATNLRRYAGQFPQHHAAFVALIKDIGSSVEILQKEKKDGAANKDTQSTLPIENRQESEKSEAIPSMQSALKTKTAPLSEPEGIFVPLAGIVLAHPFLPAFFEKNGLLHNNQFKDSAAQERAVHLLYHAATGLQHPAEEELPLIKLLCGLPIDQPTERAIELTENERTETLHLLCAIAENWPALTGISPDDLRGTFFIREGKLRRGDMGLYLTVEEKTLDILLSSLPWGLSPILHTWMPEMVWVEWA
jgi:hypothetical protein